MIKIFFKLQQMDQLIRFKCTGCPLKFAEKMEISPRTLFNYLNLRADLGAQIHYNSYIKSYEYTSTGKLHIGYFE
jgi:hypothetical protein